MAAETTLHRLRQSVFFPGMSKEVHDFVQSCTTCQAKEKHQTDQRHTLVSPTAGYPFQRLHIDFVGPLNEGKRTGAKYILTCRDSFSKWIEAFPLPKATASATVRTLEKEIFARYGMPESIHSDCGQQFMSKLFKEVGEALGIQITNTTGYNPKGNGQVERMHRDLNKMLRALTANNFDSWEDVLPQALFALRTAICKSTGLTPHRSHLQISRQPRSHNRTWSLREKPERTNPPSSPIRKKEPCHSSTKTKTSVSPTPKNLHHWFKSLAIHTAHSRRNLTKTPILLDRAVDNLRRPRQWRHGSNRPRPLLGE